MPLPNSIDAPYNFVPLSPWVHTPDWGWRVSHDLPFRNGISGHLDLTIAAESPLLVSREHKKDEGPSKEHPGQAHPYQLPAPDGRYAIPGTALKGMIRSVVEIASFSRMGMVDDVRHGLRDISGKYVAASYTAKVRDQMQTGFMRRGDDGLPRITPCSMVRLDHPTLEDWLGPKVPIFPADRAVKKKYETWERVCSKAGQDPAAVSFSPSGWEAAALGRGTKVGVPVLTGQISDSTKDHGKRRDFVFYDERPAEAFAPTRQEWSDFLFVHGDQATKDAEAMSWPGYWKRRYWDGEAVPVFYLRDGDKARIGLAYMPRLAGDFSVHEMRNHTSPEHGHTEGAPDFAETLFGRVGDGPDACLKGRVTFHHAVAIEQHPPKATEATILNGPKASYFPNYLQQPVGPDGRLRDGKGYATCLATSANPEPKLRGWKRYPTRLGDATVQDLTDEQKPNKRVQVVLNPLDEGTQFATRVDFHNLRIEEFGAVCWALTWGGAEGLRHGLGMGKPCGFGQVSIAITAADLRPNRLDAPGATWEEARDAFIDYMDRHHAEAHKGATWRTSPQIRALLGMADPTKADQFKGALQHMRLEPKKGVNDFVKAKQFALALTDYPSKEHPSTLGEQREAERKAWAEAQKTDEDRKIDDLEGLFQQAQATRNKNPGGPLGQRFNTVIEEARIWPQDRKDRLIDLLQRINKFLDGDRKKRAARMDALK